MAINFKNIAKAQTVISDIMTSREKVNNKEGIFTITDFDFVSGTKGAYVVCAVNDREYINGGLVLTRIFQECVAQNGGDLEATREDYRRSGGIRVKLSRSFTKSGNTIVKVDVLD